MKKILIVFMLVSILLLSSCEIGPGQAGAQYATVKVKENGKIPKLGAYRVQFCQDSCVVNAGVQKRPGRTGTVSRLRAVPGQFEVVLMDRSGKKVAVKCFNLESDRSGWRMTIDANDGINPCSLMPTIPVCGNGQVESGEQCEFDAQCAAGETCTSCQCVGATTYPSLCTDPDGDDQYVLGNTVLETEIGSPLGSAISSMQDTCADPSTLTEYICDGNNRVTKTYDCGPNLCLNGVCVAGMYVKRCDDSDGDNQFVQGTTLYEEGMAGSALGTALSNMMDYCSDSSTLVEYNCDSQNNRVTKTYDCECANGVCEGSIPITTNVCPSGEYVTGVNVYRGNNPEGATGAGCNLVAVPSLPDIGDGVQFICSDGSKGPIADDEKGFTSTYTASCPINAAVEKILLYYGGGRFGTYGPFFDGLMGFPMNEAVAGVGLHCINPETGAALQYVHWLGEDVNSCDNDMGHLCNVDTATTKEVGCTGQPISGLTYTDGYEAFIWYSIQCSSSLNDWVEDVQVTCGGQPTGGNLELGVTGCMGMYDGDSTDITLFDKTYNIEYTFGLAQTASITWGTSVASLALTGMSSTSTIQLHNSAWIFGYTPGTSFDCGIIAGEGPVSMRQSTLRDQQTREHGRYRVRLTRFDVGGMIKPVFEITDTQTWQSQTLTAMAPGELRYINSLPGKPVIALKNVIAFQPFAANYNFFYPEEP